MGQAAPRPDPAPQPDRLPAPQPARQPGPGGIADEITPAQAAELLAETRADRSGRPRAAPARRRTHRGPAPPGRPAAPDPGTARRRGQGMRHQPDRGIRHRPGDRRPHHRRRRGHRPVRQPGRLRCLQRHRPDRSLLVHSAGRAARGIRYPDHVGGYELGQCRRGVCFGRGAGGGGLPGGGPRWEWSLAGSLSPSG